MQKYITSIWHNNKKVETITISRLNFENPNLNRGWRCETKRGETVQQRRMQIEPFPCAHVYLSGPSRLVQVRLRKIKTPYLRLYGLYKISRMNPTFFVDLGLCRPCAAVPPLPFSTASAWEPPLGNAFLPFSFFFFATVPLLRN